MWKETCERVEGALEWGGVKKDFAFTATSFAGLVASLCGLQVGGIDPAWIAVVLCGTPILLEAAIGLTTRFDVKTDVLVALALVASIYLGEYFAAGEVAVIMALGELLEELATSKARSATEKLGKLIPTRAMLVDSSGNARETDVDAVVVGDVLRIAPGETIPVDGRIKFGETYVDEKTTTGEATPAAKKVGDVVLSGTTNLYGSFDMVAEKVGSESSVQRILALVRAVDVDGAKIVRAADKWATWFVAASLLTAIVVLLAGLGLRRAATVLIVFCPCAFVLATPTALVAALGATSSRGFIVRSGDAFERLARVNFVAFDKTGTLTVGNLEATKVCSWVDDVSAEEMLSHAAAVEARSEHPIGKAIVARCVAQGGAIKEVEEFWATPGRGARGRVDGTMTFVGSLEYLKESRIDASLASTAPISVEKGAAFVAMNGRAVGYISMRDAVREESKATLDAFRALGIETATYSGDDAKTTERVAKQLGADYFVGGMTPLDKKRKIDELRASGRVACMVGDGINDAAALRSADVGVAMGCVGNDLAIEAADVVLTRDNIGELPGLVRYARKVGRTISSNLLLSTALNFIAVALAVVGALSPVAGALAHNAGSVAVILNSALLARRWG